MKKISIIVAGLALVAASCTKIETVENGNGNVAGGISFSAYASRLSKAAQEDVTTANLLSFEASAVGNGAVYFDDVTFTKSTVWESSPCGSPAVMRMQNSCPALRVLPIKSTESTV